MRPVIDYEFTGGGRREALAALARFYPRNSPKRHLLRLLNAANQLTVRRKPSYDGPVAAAVERLPRPAPGNARAVLSHKIRATKRVYAFDIDRMGHATIVWKIALTNEAAKGLEKEQCALAFIAEKAPFQVPSLLHYRDWDGGGMIATTAAPKSFLLHGKSNGLQPALFEAIGGLSGEKSPLSLAEFDDDRWRRTWGVMTNERLRKVISDEDDLAQLDFRSCHGDLGSENVLSINRGRAVSDYYLVDWEHFSQFAPALVDEVGYWLGAHHRSFKGWRTKSALALTDLFLRWAETAKGGRFASVVALIYLASRGIDLAQMLIGSPVERE